MNTKHTYRYLYRWTGCLICLLCLLSGLVACSDTEDPDLFPEKMVTLSLRLNTGNFVTRAGTDPSAIRTVGVIVLEKKENDTYQYQYLATPVQNEENNRYEIRLYPTDQPVKLSLIANMEDLSSLLTALTTGSGTTTEEEIREALLVSFENGTLEELPMYGEVVYENGITEASTSIEEISMLRSMATVKVSLVESLFEDETFLLKSIQAYRTNDRIQVIPDPTAFYENEDEDETEWKVITPSVPQTAGSTITTPSVNAGNSTVQSLGPVYLPESETKTDIISEATCLIIGGVYKGDGYETSTRTTYYRIDFKNASGEPTGQILRNHFYAIEISAVNGPGTTHPEEADEKDIIVKITNWEESEHEIDDLGKTD